MQVYMGIDWSEEQHEVLMLNPAAAILAQFSVRHSPSGFEKLEAIREQVGVAAAACLVALETSHHLLIDFLWARGYTQVYVVPPNVVKSSRGRYRQSGARSDQSDAYLLANLLRTDQVRLQPWHPDSPLTQQLRAQISLYRHLSRSAVRLENRLRAVLLRYYPAALQVFAHLDSHIALQFLQAYPTPQAAAELTYTQFQTFAQQHHYTHPQQLPRRFAALQAPQPQAAPHVVQIYQSEAVTLAKLLWHTMQARNRTKRSLAKLFQQHPDHAIFASLPGVGDVLGAGLLVKFGDDRRRFPTPGSVQALAGTCPVTEWSGKRKVIKFRRACDRSFRHFAQLWAKYSLQQSVWANAYYQQVRPRCGSESHAYRCLANRWLAIAWKLWQTRQPYDEAYHLRQRAARSQVKLL